MITRTITTKYGTCVIVGSVHLHLTNEIPVAMQEWYFPISPEWSIARHTSISEVVHAIGLGAFDYALPQWFFDEYINDHGHAPRGVWFYPPRGQTNHLFGVFLSLESMFKSLVRIATEAAQ